MAAVAGTKGRICVENSSKDSFQMSLVNNLLDNSVSISAAAITLAENTKIRELGVDTNMVCNLDCSYCYLADRIESKGTADLSTLTKYLNEHIVDGAKLIAFIGKEPLADDRAISVIQALNKLKPLHDFRTGMVTNGTLIERRIDVLIEANPSYIDVSIDGTREVNDEQRGTGAHEQALNGIKLLLDTPLKKSLSTTTVLWNRSLGNFIEHANNMFDLGVETCFGSPVLNFAVGNKSEDFAVSITAVSEFINSLVKAFPSQANSHQQIMIDLPYRYTWSMLMTGFIPAKDVIEDCYEALYWPVPGSIINVKVNPFSFSYFRALRVTHDGTIVENMDLAAHKQYARGAQTIETQKASHLAPNFVDLSSKFHANFLSSHLQDLSKFVPFERALAKQFDDHSKRVTENRLQGVA